MCVHACACVCAACTREQSISLARECVYGVRVNAMTAELLQPIADEDVEHARRGPRALLLLINGVLDPRDGLWSGVWLSGCIRVAEMRCGRHLIEGRVRGKHARRERARSGRKEREREAAHRLRAARDVEAQERRRENDRHHHSKDDCGEGWLVHQPLAPRSRGGDEGELAPRRHGQADGDHFVPAQRHDPQAGGQLACLGLKMRVSVSV